MFKENPFNMKIIKFILTLGIILTLTIDATSAQGTANSERNDYLIALGLFEDGLYQSTELRLQEFLYQY